LQKENLLNEELQEIEIFDKPGLFSNGRLRDEDVPDGLYRYDLRGSDYDPGQPITVEKTVVVNHAASVLMAEELDLGAEGRLELGEEGLNFTGAELTVREFMEEQQQKRNGLIHGDSDHIAVEGHIGTWYAVDETEVGGEKFFLLEHEEHGDMAACVAVNEQGKLVAEDLWNGFDEDFQEAVQKYFSEKWNMPKKEDVVSEIIEKATPVPDNSAQDYSDVPVYYEPFSYAKENDEVDLYRTSYRLNSECKQAIHEAIADNYDGMYLGDGAVDQVVKQYGMERVGYILANTLHHKSYDGRFSPGNKEWAEQVSTPEHNADRMTFRADWVVDSHPAVLDGFVTMFRKELEAQKEQEQPFVKQFYVVENLQAAPLKIERFGNLDDAMSQYQALPSHLLEHLCSICRKSVHLEPCIRIRLRDQIWCLSCASLSCPVRANFPTRGRLISCTQATVCSSTAGKRIAIRLPTISGLSSGVTSMHRPFRPYMRSTKSVVADLCSTRRILLLLSLF